MSDKQWVFNNLQKATDLIEQQQREIESLKKEVRLSTKEALLMVQAMHKDFYANSDDAELFKPLDTASGLLTQIDNMYAGIRNDYHELKTERDTLAAHVKRLQNVALNEILKWVGNSDELLIRRIWNSVRIAMLKQSPQTDLAERDREVEARQAEISYNAGYIDCLHYIGKPTEATSLNAARQAKQHANKIRTNKNTND